MENCSIWPEMEITRSLRRDAGKGPTMAHSSADQQKGEQHRIPCSARGRTRHDQTTLDPTGQLPTERASGRGCSGPLVLYPAVLFSHLPAVRAECPNGEIDLETSACCVKTIRHGLKRPSAGNNDALAPIPPHVWPFPW
jgi:hypothetical protein